ncbi:MAG: hypothetical protein JXL67_14220, partial [Calditrichaeota bacterium]|nr:hypothetical protein [Calditrichota bacterium]
VMAYLHKVKIKLISIGNEEEFGGIFEWEDLFGRESYPMETVFDDLVKLEKSVMIVLAGPIAASIIKYGKKIWTGEEDAYDHAMEILSWMGSSNESTELLFRLYSKRCELILRCPDVRCVLEQFASILFQKERITGVEAENNLKDLFEKV